jgi:hypothetical protein
MTRIVSVTVVYWLAAFDCSHTAECSSAAPGLACPVSRPASPWLMAALRLGWRPSPRGTIAAEAGSRRYRKRCESARPNLSVSHQRSHGTPQDGLGTSRTLAALTLANLGLVRTTSVVTVLASAGDGEQRDQGEPREHGGGRQQAFNQSFSSSKDAPAADVRRYFDLVRSFQVNNASRMPRQPTVVERLSQEAPVPGVVTA